MPLDEGRRERVGRSQHQLDPGRAQPERIAAPAVRLEDESFRIRAEVER
ncbi:MAG TPA: hypothetical protein VMW80_11380 [Candidatus Dormibacteraeota bacterium]|nr:hypothetical protein [Candidatus Dormibacteraeota bacterium]